MENESNTITGASENQLLKDQIKNALAQVPKRQDPPTQVDKMLAVVPELQSQVA